MLGVGGLLLLPVYTHALSQAEFGTYVVIKANIEIFGYVLYFGLPSAVARLYFDYQRDGQHFRYVSSVFILYLINTVVAGIVLALCGDRLWAALSPGVDSWPYLWWTAAIAWAGFLPALAGILLRLQGRVTMFVAVQLLTAAVLIALAIAGLIHFQMGLQGLLVALLGSACFAGAALPALFGKHFRPVLQPAHIRASMHYAAPIVVGYFSYFVLNRAGTLVLQRHVDVTQIAIFGLGQQLALIVSMSATAFGKALQPAVFSAEVAHVSGVLSRAGRLFLALLFAVAALVILYASDLLALVAPRTYGSARSVMLILVVGSFLYALKLIPDTALLYHRKPKTSVAVSIVGAAASAALTWWLVPVYQLQGAASASAVAAALMTATAYACAHRAGSRQPVISPLAALTALIALAVLSGSLDASNLSRPVAAGLKTMAAFGALAGALAFYRAKDTTQ